MAGKLYIVPTPIGNLKDMTFRAVEVLQQAHLILAEDTRTSAPLLKHYGITTPMRSHHKWNEHETAGTVAQMIEGGQTVALISDAGTPAISDPGFMLARECRLRGLELETLPGATAFVPALVNSGLPCDRFVFEGFLPQKKGRQARLDALRDESRTMIFYEAPTRLLKTLTQLAQTFGQEREATVCREISKLHDTAHHGTLASLTATFTATQPRGEIVIVVAGKPQEQHVKVDKYAKFKNKYSITSHDNDENN